MGEPAPPRLREAEAPADDGGHLPADPYDLRDLPVRLDGDLDAARVPDLDPLLDHERRAGQEPVRRQVGRAGSRRAPRRGILDDPRGRAEHPCVDGRLRELRGEGEHVAVHPGPEPREELPELPQVRGAFARPTTDVSFAPSAGSPWVMTTFRIRPPSTRSSIGRTPISSSWCTTDEPSGWGTRPSLAATYAVPRDGCPANAISPPGVKIRFR